MNAGTEPKALPTWVTTLGALGGLVLFLVDVVVIVLACRHETSPKALETAGMGVFAILALLFLLDGTRLSRAVWFVIATAMTTAAIVLYAGMANTIEWR